MLNLLKILIVVLLCGCRVSQPMPKATPEQYIAVMRYMSGEWDIKELTAELVYLKEIE